MQREQSVLVGFVSVRALREKKLYHVLMFVLAGLVEGRCAVTGLRVDVCTWRGRNGATNDQGFCHNSVPLCGEHLQANHCVPCLLTESTWIPQTAELG